MKRIWYAAVYDQEDSDLGYGSTRKAEAIRMARAMRRAGYPNACVVVADSTDGFALDIIDI